MALTQSRLKEVLSYDPDSGKFTWKINRGSMKAGSVAGYLDSSNGYICIRLDGKLYKAHRLAWFYTHGYDPENQIITRTGYGMITASRIYGRFHLLVICRIRELVLQILPDSRECIGINKPRNGKLISIFKEKGTVSVTTTLPWTQPSPAIPKKSGIQNGLVTTEASS